MAKCTFFPIEKHQVFQAIFVFHQEKLFYSLTAVTGPQNWHEHFSPRNCKQTGIKEGMVNLLPVLSFPSSSRRRCGEAVLSPLASLEDLVGLLFITEVWDPQSCHLTSPRICPIKLTEGLLLLLFFPPVQNRFYCTEMSFSAFICYLCYTEHRARR